MNKRLAYFLGALVMAGVGLVPVKASAGWGWWGGPGISITVGPRWGYYGYRPYGYYGYSGYPYYGYRHYGYRHYGYRRYGYYGHRGHWARHAHRRWH